MDLSLLAAKQKRVNDWRRFAEGGGIPDFHLKQVTLKKIEDLQQLLNAIWGKGSASIEDHNQICNLERELEDLNEQARLNSFRGVSVAGEQN